MSAWKAKRFWKQATAVETEGGFTVQLDGRPVRTPSKTLLVVPTLGLAQAIASEWDAQQGLVRPETMPFTRSANSSLDKIIPQFEQVAEMLAAYGGTDLLCYRATGPEALVRRQSAVWDPLLDWAATELGAPLRATAGVMHIAQDQSALDRLHGMVRAFSSFQLAGFHDLVAISGSLILGFAVTRGRLAPQAAWDASRIDEAWQTEQWGEDEEAAAAEAVRHADFLQAARFYTLCG